MRLTTPFSDDSFSDLKAGDIVSICGRVITARDQAHRRIRDLLSDGQSLPFETKGSLLFYTGPVLALDKLSLSSAGPTTSRRMDKYVPLMLSLGVKAFLGKGKRSPETVDS
jgi:fumarate hydratase subunit beta